MRPSGIKVPANGACGPPAAAMTPILEGPCPAPPWKGLNAEWWLRKEAAAAAVAGPGGGGAGNDEKSKKCVVGGNNRLGPTNVFDGGVWWYMNGFGCILCEWKWKLFFTIGNRERRKNLPQMSSWKDRMIGTRSGLERKSWKEIQQT